MNRIAAHRLSSKRLHAPVTPTTIVTALASVLALAGCGELDQLVCGEDDCSFTADEWTRIRALANLGEPPPDPSNKYLPQSALTTPADPGQAARELAVVRLGQRYYFEARFSGNATWRDVLGRDTTSARAARGEPVKVSCASCHDPTRAGTDFTSSPNHVSVGAGWYDVNSQQTVNAAHYPLLYWNGRSDSLWGQAAAVMESGVSMNGSRLSIVWTAADNYRAEHDAVFVDSPLPVTGTTADVKALLAKDAAGKETLWCTGTAPDACPAGCRAVRNEDTGAQYCSPRFPLGGKPGTKPRPGTPRLEPGEVRCQAGDAAEPFGDAYDCMAADDRQKIDRAYVNVTKAIAAYEWKLVSRDALFDRFVNGDPSAQLSPAARRGLKLFVGRASCIDCHNTPFFSDGRFHNIGVPQQGASVPTEADCPMGKSCDCVTEGSTSCLPWGAHAGLGRLRASKTLRRDGPYSDNVAAGDAYAAVYAAPAPEQLALQIGAWRTPSLRDVAVTAPYMHNGFFQTLEQVIWHYDDGGATNGIGSKAVEMKPLYLSRQDRGDLVEFLKTLTGAPARTDFVTAAQP